MIFKRTKKYYIAYACLLITTAVWGAGFLLTDETLLAGATPSFVNTIRFMTAAVLVGIVFCRKIKTDGKTVLYGLIGGSMLFFGFMLQLTGLRYTTPAYNGFFTSAYILFVPFLSWITDKKRPSGIVFFGMALAVAGYFVLNFGGQWSNVSSASGTMWIGNLLTLAGSVFFASQMTFSAWALRKKGAESLTFWQLAFAAALFAIYFFAFDFKAMNFAALDLNRFILPVLFVAVLGTAFAYPAQINGQKYLQSSEVALILSMESLVGAVISVAAGRDSFSWYLLAGGLTVTAAVVTVEFVPEFIAMRRRKSELKKLKETAEFSAEPDAPTDIEQVLPLTVGSSAFDSEYAEAALSDKKD